jgi:hypothetical protein
MSVLWWVNVLNLGGVLQVEELALEERLTVGF